MIFLSQFLFAFVTYMAIAAILLLIAKIIPPLRKRPTGTYITAMILSIVLPHLITFLLGFNWVFLYMDILATIGCILVLVGLMKRAQNKLELEAKQNIEQKDLT
jgi:MFS family permease